MTMVMKTPSKPALWALARVVNEFLVVSLFVRCMSCVRCPMSTWQDAPPAALPTVTAETETAPSASDTTGTPTTTTTDDANTTATTTATTTE